MATSAATYPVSVIAKLFLLTERRVQQLTAEGVIPRAERGRYELAPAVQGYIKYLRDRAVGADAPGGDDGDHKKRLLKARADVMVMEAQRLSRTLVPADEIEAAWGAIADELRTRLLAIPAGVAPLITTGMKPVEIEGIVRDKIDEALAAIAGAGGRGNAGAGAPQAVAPADAL